MADMSKAEKLAAARKKLREFQSNRENIPSPSGDTKRSAKSQTPTSSPVPSKNGIEPKPPDLGNDLQTYSNNVTNNNSNDSLQLQMNNLHIPSQHSEQAAQVNTNNISSPNNVLPQNEVQQFLSPENMYHQTMSQPNVAENISTSTPIFTPQQQNDTQTSGELTLESIQSTSESLFQLAMQMNGLISTSTDMNATGSPTIVGEDSSMLGSSKDTDLLARNQRLASELAEREQAFDQLKASLEQLQNEAKKRDEELQRALAECEQKWMTESSALREQLQLHTQTVGILVAEKTEAQAALSRAQLAAKSKAAEAEEAQGRLRASRQRLSEMESALNSLKSGKEQESVHAHETTAELERLRRQLQTSSTQLQDVKEENSQLQHRVQLSAQQITSLQAELAEKQSQLSIAQVHLQQLGGSVPEERMVSEAQAELQLEHERCTALEQELAELRNLMAERDQSSYQYQQFIQQLNSQLTSIAAKLQETSQENTALSERNNSLVKHLSELESQLQKGPPALTPQQVEEQEKLALQVKTLADGKAVLEIKLSGEEAKVAELQSELSRLHEKVAELQEGRPDDVKLLAAMESDKVAAARATAQNTQLKQQLLESQYLHAQLTDRIRHFEAQEFETETLQKKLFDTQAQLEALMAENAQLKSMPPPKIEEPAKEATDESSLTAEAAARLQERFTETMHRLAEISDEKQRLEHLVMQLQGETETIGEYVALYQQQRGMLQQRAAEKDLEVARMAADREQMRQKLQRVGHLVSVLVSETPHPNQEASNEDAPLKNGLGSNEVAKQIAELLLEIGDSETLAEPSPHTTPLLHSAGGHTKETMLPCALCSGRLKVV